MPDLAPAATLLCAVDRMRAHNNVALGARSGPFPTFWLRPGQHWRQISIWASILARSGHESGKRSQIVRFGIRIRPARIESGFILGPILARWCWTEAKSRRFGRDRVLFLRSIDIDRSFYWSTVFPAVCYSHTACANKWRLYADRPIKTRWCRSGKKKYYLHVKTELDLYMTLTLPSTQCTPRFKSWWSRL